MFATSLRRAAWSLVGVFLLAACGEQQTLSERPDDRSNAPVVAEAASFPEAVDALDARIDELNRKFGRAFWLAATFPSPDAEDVSASVEALLRDTHIGGLAEIQRRFGDVAHEGPSARKLMHLGHRFPHPMPEDDAARTALTDRVGGFAERFEALEICFRDDCYTPVEAERRVRASDDAAERSALWRTLREEAAELAADFMTMRVRLNEAARGWGYGGMGDWLIARYERPGGEWAAELERLTEGLTPLAGALRCHVAAELDIGRDEGALPAIELRSLWGRSWAHLHDAARGDLPPYAPLPLTVEERFESVEEMVRWGEETYRSAGFPPLPESFWTGSQFTRPAREISACPRFGTNVDWYKDVRLTMCGELTPEDLIWSQGMLAFLYYDLAFADRDWVFRDPPHLGFHFANSDAMELALTPEYLHAQGLLETLPTDEERLSHMLYEALRIVPRIGYDIAAERWRYEMFSGAAAGEELDQRWRVLRRRHQGVATPAPASDEVVEPLAHILVARNIELLPGALGQVLKFQFYREACDSADYEGPLHECSFYGSEAVAERLWPVLAKGASEPWYDVLQSYTGEARMNAGPLLDYFAPLREWLVEKNAERVC